MTESEYELKIDENEHAKRILQRLDSMRRDQKNCDLVIRAGGKEIHVNRDVMCAASDYFNAMFSHREASRKPCAFSRVRTQTIVALVQGLCPLSPQPFC